MHFSRKSFKTRNEKKAAKLLQRKSKWKKTALGVNISRRIVDVVNASCVFAARGRRWCGPGKRDLQKYTHQVKYLDCVHVPAHLSYYRAKHFQYQMKSDCIATYARCCQRTSIQLTGKIEKFSAMKTWPIKLQLIYVDKSFRTEILSEMRAAGPQVRRTKMNALKLLSLLTFKYFSPRLIVCFGWNKHSYKL